MSISEHRNHHVLIRVFDRATNPYELRCLDCFCHIKTVSQQGFTKSYSSILEVIRIKQKTAKEISE